MPAVCRIVVDDREPAAGVPRALVERGVQVTIARLRYGDYALRNDVVVERKTVYGLHAAVVEGRFWQQVGQLRAGSRAPYLLVEGASLDAGALPTRAVIAVCLGVIGQGVPILWSTDPSQSAEWLHRLALRASGLQPIRDRPAYAHRPKPEHSRVPGRCLLRFRESRQGERERCSKGSEAWPE
jgi:ERCC4-type nuclease